MLTFRNTSIAFVFLFIGLVIIHYSVFSIHYSVFILLILAYKAMIIYGCSYIGSGYFLQAICKANNSQHEIAITFDDGPDKSITPEILNLLQENQVKATFFCIGRKVEKEKELLKTIDEQGHLVGNHSYSHAPFFDFYSTDKVRKELILTNGFIKEAISKEPLLFRPPYGVTNPNIASAVNALGLTTIGWSVRSLDGVSKNEAEILKRVTKNLKSGDIILFHDTSETSLNVLKKFLVFTKQNNFKIVSLDKLLNINAYA